ncbi:hypothetical protein AAFF_G00431270 [Aldrovandia affinis]|uniref:Uncharacterized protein n=1 Tax=Aldrovandia affinis TaxID=143900 RepID=A0AAD7S8R7_9TELE|nr:hypothetical protein AAFF_G00431270 [Aldrovandia affinis]
MPKRFSTALNVAAECLRKIENECPVDSEDTEASYDSAEEESFILGLDPVLDVHIFNIRPMDSPSPGYTHGYQGHIPLSLPRHTCSACEEEEEAPKWPPKHTRGATSARAREEEDERWCNEEEDTEQAQPHFIPARPPGLPVLVSSVLVPAVFQLCCGCWPLSPSTNPAERVQ